MTVLRGERFEAMMAEVHQDRINSEAVKELLGDDVIKVTKTITMNQLRTSRHTGEKPKFIMPDLSNATPVGLVDMLGDVREQIKDLQKLEGIYKEALTARLKE